MRLIRIWVCYFTRSEFGPLEPLIRELQFREDVDLKVESFARNVSMDAISYSLDEFDPDMVLCGFDRPEMVPVAYTAYHKDVPIAQIFAGDLAGGAYDDADRFALSSYSTLLFCASLRSKQRVTAALRWRDEMYDDKRVHLVGATHFDDMKDNGHPTDVQGPYDLVLYNPPSMASYEQIKKELLKIQQNLKKGRAVVWIEPNGDKFSKIVNDFAIKLEGTLWKKSMLRPDFLSYLKYCERFIGNSSSMSYEAPYLKRITVQIGMRNRFRERIPEDKCKPGASKRIADLMIDFCKERFYNGERDE